DQRGTAEGLQRTMLWLEQRPRHPDRRGLHLLRTGPDPRHARGAAAPRRSRPRGDLWARRAAEARAHEIRALSRVRVRGVRAADRVPAGAASRARTARPARSPEPPAGPAA